MDPLGNAKFAISFVPSELADHFISIAFNKEVVPGLFVFTYYPFVSLLSIINTNNKLVLYTEILFFKMFQISNIFFNV